MDKEKDSRANKTLKNICLNTMKNFKPYNLKILFTTNERWLYVSSIPVSTYFIYRYDRMPHVVLPRRVYLLTLCGYFFYKGVYITAKEAYLAIKYKKIAEIFNGKVQVVSVSTNKKKEVIYTLHSFLPAMAIESKRQELSWFFINTNIVSVDQDKKNKKLFYLRTRKFIKNPEKMLLEDRLMRVLENYNLKANLIGKSENEFITIVKVVCDADIIKVLGKTLDITSKLKLNKDELSIKVVRDQFHFEIKKSEQPIYLFHEYMRQDLKGKEELPFILGINQSTGQLVVEDMANLKNTLVIGIPGSGKSCHVNDLLQSSMAFDNNCLYVLGDLKGNELNQYLGFRNCIFINSHIELADVLKNIISEVEQRYKQLGTCKNLKDYNDTKRKNLPYILVFIDELAEVMNSEDSKLAEIINKRLLRIANLGRACGVFLIGATQRPSSTQFSTDNRAAFNTTITYRVANKRECSFTDSPGAEKLMEGEFIINGIRYDIEKFKGLWIDHKKQNYIFEELKEMIADGRSEHVVNLDKNP